MLRICISMDFWHTAHQSGCVERVLLQSGSYDCNICTAAVSLFALFSFHEANCFIYILKDEILVFFHLRPNSTCRQDLCVCLHLL